MKKFLICFVIFVITGIASAFHGVPGYATFVVGGICALLYFLYSRKKMNSTNKIETGYSSKSSSTRYQTSKDTDFWDQRNIPSHWTKARACIEGDHDDVTISRGDASRCFKCGRPFDGVWGDRGVIDGYFCQIHKKWIPRGNYCIKCKNEGLI